MSKIRGILRIFGYLQSGKKPNLFYKKMGSLMFFVDLRSKYHFSNSYFIAFFVMPIEKTCFKEFQDWSEDGYFIISGNWKLNRLINQEFKRLTLAGVEAEWTNEGSWSDVSIDGYCVNCGKDHQTYNEFCSKDCEVDFGLKNGIMKRCVICNTPFYTDDLVDHHLCYETDTTIKICKSCHAKVHHSNDSICTKYQPIDKRPKKEPKIRVKCDKCGCQTYKPQQYHQYKKDWKKEVVTVCCKCYKKILKEGRRTEKTRIEGEMERKWNYRSFYR